MTRTAWDCLPSRLPGVVPELSDQAALRRSLELHETARDTMSREMSFDSLLSYCTATRFCWNVIHDASLFDVSGESVRTKDLVEAFVAALESSDPIIEKLIEGLSDEVEIRLAQDYRDSIEIRCGFASILLRQGMEQVYVEMRKTARPESEIPHAVKHIMADKIRRSLPVNRAGFVRVAFAWLRHKLALLAAELRLEHGPWAIALYGQNTIAIRTKDSVPVIRRCMEELCAEETQDKVRPYLARLDEYLGSLDTKIVGALQGIVDRVLEHCPDRGLWVQERNAIERVLGEEAQSLVESLQEDVLSLQKDIESWSRQLEMLCGPGELSVLIHEERCDDCDPWLAHALELGLVAQGERAESSIENLLPLVQIRLEDIGTRACSHPLPAQAEYFDSFDAGEDCTTEYGVSEKFAELCPVVARRVAAVPAY